MKRKIISSSIIIAGMIIAIGILFAQEGSTSAVADSFGFEKNILHRKSADTESVLGCMTSCQEMLTGWQEMNPDSKNYVKQKEKITAKAEQCLAMNELAGFPSSEEEILASCGLSLPHCAEIPSEIPIDSGACTDISFIRETNLPQCCTTQAPRGIDCGADQEWVVGVAAFPVCYIPGS